jgi:uncharacterized repeat protein (TIGR02543 family)
VSVTYDPNTHAASLTCVPGAQTVTVAITSQDGSGSAIAAPNSLISSQPAGINCPGTCSVRLAYNTSVTLTETTPTGWHFAGWGGACASSGLASSCTLKVPVGGQAVGATFLYGTALTVTLNSLTAGVDGSVNLAVGTRTYPACTDNGGSQFTTCVYAFAPGAQVKLTAAPNQFYFFVSWSGDCSGTTPSCTVVMTSQDRNVTATFQ